MNEKKVQINTSEYDDLIFDMLVQACIIKSGKIDNMCLSVYEDACTHLVRKGYLTTENGRIYSIVRAGERKVKKSIKMDVVVTVPIFYTKTFEITREVDIDEKWMKEEGWSEEQYVEEMYEEEYTREAEKLMDKQLDEVELCDCEFNDYESEFDY